MGPSNHLSVYPSRLLRLEKILRPRTALFTPLFLFSKKFQTLFWTFLLSKTSKRNSKRNNMTTTETKNAFRMIEPKISNNVLNNLICSHVFLNILSIANMVLIWFINFSIIDFHCENRPC